MLLENKTAVIFGAGGSLGGAVAKAFAKAGATVFLSGKNKASVEATANAINAGGGTAFIAVVDALDTNAVERHLKEVVSSRGRVDISFNAVSLEDVQGTALIDMDEDDFLRPIQRAMQTQYSTATVVGKQMKAQGSGVILSLTATPGGIGYAMSGGFGVACCAIESFSCTMAAELGIYGVRAVNIRSGGSPDSKPFLDAIANDQKNGEAFLQKIKDDSMLKAMPMMADIANVAVFLASDMASKITGVTIDVTCGTTAALNYKLTDMAFVYK